MATKKEKLKEEAVSLVSCTVYFIAWIGVMIVIKNLVLAEYHIGFSRLSMAVVGALVLAKVVLVLQHVSLGEWVRTRPAWIHVLLRTALYGLGVCVVLILEEAFRGRDEHGGFWPSLIAVFGQAGTPHVWANSICLSGALLVYNAVHVVQAHLGKGGLLRVFTRPLPEEPHTRT